jgi:hypothetical protein
MLVGLCSRGALLKIDVPDMERATAAGLRDAPEKITDVNDLRRE